MLFDKPAEKWEQYLPLGNGRLGCMVKAHPSNEIIQLNEEGIWSGGPQDRINPDAKKLENISYDDIIKNGLKVMDTAACALCKQNNIPIVVFDFDLTDGITDILHDKKIGTYIN